MHGLYGSKSFDEFTNYVREAITELVPAEPSVFVTIDLRNRQTFGRGPVPHIPGLDELTQKHQHEHPFVNYQLSTLDFSAIKISDFLSEEQLHRSEFVYHRFMRHMDAEDNFTLCLPYAPQDALDNRASQVPDLVVDTVNLFRQERSFTERDRIILNLLQPHLMQARQTAQSFTELQQTQKKLQDCLETAGSILIGQEGRVHTMTQKAERLLKHSFHDFEHFSRGLPERLKQWVKYQRSLLTSHNSSLKPLSPLKVEQGNKLLNVRFAADISKDQYLLLLSEQKRPVLSAELLETLGLSRREAEVLFLVMDGKTNPEIASVLHLSISTVRKHLEHIYFKLGVQTRAAAVVSAFKKLGVLNLDWAADSGQKP
ncbi:MAG TPA: helix-turn-helix transcriptional regulator [Candidatus Obscuribacterales bacterium]